MTKPEKDRFKKCFDNMLDCFAIFQAKRNHLGEIVDLIYERVNEAACINAGLTKEQQLGKGMLEVYPSYKSTGLFEKYCQVVETGKSLEFEDLSYEGDIAISGAYDIRATKIEDGIAIFWRNVTCDITDNKRCQSLLTNMSDGFAYCKMIYENGAPEDFVHLAVNEAFTTLTGLQDVVGKKMTEVIPVLKTANPELLEIYGRVARTGLSERFEIYIVPLDVWLSISVSSRRDGNFMVIFDNITERKSIEQALNECIMKYRMLFENINDAIFLLELDDGGKSVCFREVNDVACRRLGYSREELLSFSLDDIQPDATANDRANFNPKLQIEKDATFETMHKAKDGTLIPVELSVRYFIMNGVSYALGIARDLSQRKQAERMLKTSYMRMRRNHLLNELIEAESLSEQQAHEMLVEAGLKLSGPLTCYLVNLQEWKGESRDYWKQHLEKMHFLQETVVDLLSEDDYCLAWKSSDGVGILHSGLVPSLDAKGYQTKLALQMQEKVELHIPELKFEIGVSELSAIGTCVSGLYQQCCTAIKVGKKIWPDKRIYHYLDMGVYQLVPFINDREQVAGYVERTLGKLLRYDKQKRTDYILTLELILEINNLKEVAKKAFVHQKTVELRKRRIEQVLGVSLGSFETRMALAIALKLIKIGGEE